MHVLINLLINKKLMTSWKLWNKFVVWRERLGWVN
jgi:hypothetical protein